MLFTSLALIVAIMTIQDSKKKSLLRYKLNYKPQLQLKGLSTNNTINDYRL